ncbi:ABC transporter permease subunit [Turicibacter sanguinis]|uniref:ABC transporter permease subunit n=1 Tax=Turicibacter sanguinis TaxID=154288 RepID=UPI0018A8848F|nr:ABC transporter permease subunit [Turicibacter sanguinis]MDB8552666.1 ABC transporter permease subunit [Turicibacter sanguinis]
MISFPLLWQTTKSNFKYLLIFTTILCVFLTVMCNVFTPQTLESIQHSTEGSIISQILGDGTLISFMSNYFYAIMAIIFPMVYSILVGNRLIAEKIDRGTMSCLLSTPTTRLQITISSSLYFILSLIFMWIVATGVGIVAAKYFQPDALDIETFISLNIGCFLYHFVISSICFCASCIFNLSKTSLAFGAGIPLAFFVINLFIKLSEDLDWLKYFTLNTLFDTQKIIEGSGFENNFIIMLLIGIILYLTGIIIFNQKDLPL